MKKSTQHFVNILLQIYYEPVWSNFVIDMIKHNPSVPEHKKTHNYKFITIADLCRTLVQTGGILGEEDRMIQESLSYIHGAAHPRFSSEGIKEAPCSSVDEPVPALADRSSDDSEVDDTSNRATRMEVGTATVHASATLSTDSGREGDPTVGHDLYDDPNEHRVDDIHDFCSAIFKSVSEPLLPRLASPPTSPPKQVCSKRTGRKLKNMVTTRSSLACASRRAHQRCRWLNGPRGS